MNMGYQEYLSWIKYREKHGGLNVAFRIDRALGIIATHFANHGGMKFTSGRKPNPDDFTPYPQKPKEQELTPQYVAAILASAAASGDK